MKIKIIKRIVVTLILCVVILAIIMSSSPKNLVRARILFSGHAASALQCNPKKNSVMTKAEKMPVWSIEKKYSSLDVKGSLKM